MDAIVVQKNRKKKEKPVGSEFYNTLACLVGDYFMKIGATLPPCDWKTKMLLQIWISLVTTTDFSDTNMT